MDMQNKIKILGVACIVIGITAALLCISPLSGSIFIALPVGFIGMICSSIYVFIDTKNEINTKKFTPGIIGMLLSSTPVLWVLTFIILNHFKH